jgi:hypothetical protein
MAPFEGAIFLYDPPRFRTSWFSASKPKERAQELVAALQDEGQSIGLNGND